jgi:tRNA threonylcarbamoyladenosine biosynthesis protein TsaB
MTSILAIETATDACSVALYQGGEYRELYEVTPRRHNQRLFTMLEELLPSGRLAEQGIDAIAWGEGPGSFTGLRVAASAVQGLAFANNLPCIGVSTILCQAQRALREGLVTASDQLFSAVDARIGELYFAQVGFRDGLAVLQGEVQVARPEQLELPQQSGPLIGVGSGLELLSSAPEHTRQRITPLATELMPSARDLLPLALALLAQGETQSAQQVAPVYVRDTVNWKKLSEQGKKQT